MAAVVHVLATVPRRENVVAAEMSVQDMVETLVFAREDGEEVRTREVLGRLCTEHRYFITEVVIRRKHTEIVAGRCAIDAAVAYQRIQEGFELIKPYLDEGNLPTLVRVVERARKEKYLK